MIKSLAAVILIGMALPAPTQAASMVEFGKRMDELHKFQEFKRSDPARAKTLLAPSNGSMVGFAKKMDAMNNYQYFKRWCHYKHNGDYTCDHPTW